MKAVLTKEVGGPETVVVENIDTPAPGKGEVLVDVAACAINYPDTLMIRDLYQFKPERPYSPGGEISGTVTRQESSRDTDSSRPPAPRRDPHPGIAR